MSCNRLRLAVDAAANSRTNNDSASKNSDSTYQMNNGTAGEVNHANAEDRGQETVFPHPVYHDGDTKPVKRKA